MHRFAYLQIQPNVYAVAFDTIAPWSRIKEEIKCAVREFKYEICGWWPCRIYLVKYTVKSARFAEMKKANMKHGVSSRKIVQMIVRVFPENE